MKNFKKVIALFAVIMLFTLSLSGCKKNKDDKLVTVRLNEVVRSLFYAPMYVAINEGFFEEEGIEIDLSTGQGADKTMQQVLSGNADIGFSGPEQIIYIYNQGRDDYPIVFAQLTQRDGSFLVGNKEEKNFDWKSLKGKTVIGGRPGGVPEMTFEYVLKKNGLDPKEDLEIITNIAFTATAGAFKSGTGEYVTLFEPTATTLVEDGSGHIVASIGDSAGPIPYTCYFATKSYMEKNPEIIEKFTRAIYKGQLWVQEHSEDKIADKIASFFPGIDKEILTKSIRSYKDINAYADTPVMTEESLDRLMDIIESYDNNLMPQRPEFNIIVDNSYSEKVIDE
ncbi:ABC transporter substrate-binding protein [Oceanirhabdus sp. W0125-5]|uniref:ABC transporter substrate-binding protein n=1 Tax=Oceanirhabdus sp. W0125-5 TaxID=2999116 RepID=UPI0022F32E85|nr:ABC transporter substrate-binding protein [Oceanirhabdus sp. W0125-5]WBW96551.1 ABC transporter substrate-binding protein [Oceanirhabdus sp. W0125-5]